MASKARGPKLQKLSRRLGKADSKRTPASPLDVLSVSANISAQEIVAVVRRERGRARGVRRRA